jgi:OOP family OmpA-OmpF porin
MPDLHRPTTPTAPHPNGNLEELQKLLLEAERGRLDRLEDRLRNSVVDASAVANVLPAAICQRTKQDQHLETSLAPIIGKIFVRGIKGSPQLIADAISPVMMQAIRKAIQTAVQGMLQTMNRTLDHSGLSRRGMTWRWEALTTGKSFSDVVLSHTLSCAVERVFLFFREDGAQLCNVDGPGIPPFELGHEDLVTSMFSAIKTAVQKFAQDEFQASEQASMKEFKMDDGLTVLIEQGPKAVLAAVVRGLPSPSLRPTLQDALDSIHVELNEALQNFRGNKKAFEAARPHLESCLLHEEIDFPNETGSARGRLSPTLMVMLMLLLTSLVWGITWGVTSYLERQRWADFLDKASETPGIHITSTTANGKNGKTTVYGLRDPLSDNPQEIAREAGLPHEAIDFQLEPYLSLQPELVARRAKDILHPPESVRLSVPNGTTQLNLAGTAPHAWIAQLPKIGSTIPGVTSIQYAGLQDESQLRLDQLVREIEAHQADFEAGSASLSTESGSAMERVLQALREGDALAQQLDHRIQVEVRGHTSEEGSVETNHRLALARAQRILSALNGERFRATDLLSVAESVGSSATAEMRARRVSFHVTVNDSGSTRPMP